MKTWVKVAICTAGAAFVAAGLLLMPKGDKAPFLERPARFVTDITKSEEMSDKVAAAVKSALMKPVKSRDWARVPLAFTSDFRARFPGPIQGMVVPDKGLKITRFEPRDLQEHDAASFVAALRARVDPWSLVERTTWRPFEFLITLDEKKAFASVHFQVAGPRPDGGRSDFQATLEVEVVDDGTSWKLRRLALVSGVVLENPDRPFEDVTQATGFEFNLSERNQRNAQALINDRAIRTDGGLTCLDWNDDGFPDILATVAEKYNVLFLNDGQGGFRRSESPVARQLESPFFLLAVDLDGDGREECVTTRCERSGERWALSLYQNRSGAWTLLPDALPFASAPGLRNFMYQALVPCDVDRDGDLDVWVAGYSTSESGKESFNSLGSFDGCDNLLFINHGGLRFTEESDARGMKGTQYTYVGAFFDFDFDGDEDLLEGNDWGPDILWLNEGKGRFEESKGHALTGRASYTMGFSIADYDNTGTWSLHVSNMYSHAGNRIVPLAGEVQPELRKRALVLAQGNFQFEYDPGAREWVERGIERGVNWADWAWGCVFHDLDNDADKDLFVANGFTSHEDASAPDW